MEKSRPTFVLEVLKNELGEVERLRMTRTSKTSAYALGLTLVEIVALIQSTSRRHFYKSMTAHADPKTWQDVYHVPGEGLVLYLKFSRDTEGHLVLSLKEK